MATVKIKTRKWTQDEYKANQLWGNTLLSEKGPEIARRLKTEGYGYIFDGEHPANGYWVKRSSKEYKTYYEDNGGLVPLKSSRNSNFRPLTYLIEAANDVKFLIGGKTLFLPKPIGQKQLKKKGKPKDNEKKKQPTKTQKTKKQIKPFPHFVPDTKDEITQMYSLPKRWRDYYYSIKGKPTTISSSRKSQGIDISGNPIAGSSLFQTGLEGFTQGLLSGITQKMDKNQKRANIMKMFAKTYGVKPKNLTVAGNPSVENIAQQKTTTLQSKMLTSMMAQIDNLAKKYNLSDNEKQAVISVLSPTMFRAMRQLNNDAFNQMIKRLRVGIQQAHLKLDQNKAATRGKATSQFSISSLSNMISNTSTAKKK